MFTVRNLVLKGCSKAKDKNFFIFAYLPNITGCIAESERKRSSPQEILGKSSDLAKSFESTCLT